jgi:hypothetical protein
VGNPKYSLKERKAIIFGIFCETPCSVKCQVLRNAMFSPILRSAIFCEVLFGEVLNSVKCHVLRSAYSAKRSAAALRLEQRKEHGRNGGGFVEEASSTKQQSSHSILDSHPTHPRESRVMEEEEKNLSIDNQQQQLTL